MSMSDEMDFDGFQDPMSPDEAPAHEEHLSEFEESGYLSAALIGKDTREVDILGHSVAMHTLTVEESLKAALIAKEYAGSGGSILATKTAMLAAAIDAIDAETLYAPAKINDNEIYGKYKALVTGYYPTFIGECYEEYSKMEREQAEKVDRLKKSRA